MFRIAKERELEEQEEKKTKELHKMLDTFKQPAAKSTSTFSSGETNGVKKSVSTKITIKPKKVKTEEESVGKGQINLLDEPKKPEPKPKSAALNLCSYSDDDE